MYFDLVMFWMSDYAWMANFRCHFLIKGLLTNRIALLLPVRGRTELGKMFGTDCRQFLFSPPLPFLAHLHPTFPRFLRTPGALLRSPTCSPTSSTLRPEKEKKGMFENPRISKTTFWRFQTLRQKDFKNGTQWLMQHKEFRDFWIAWKVSAIHNFLGSIRYHPTHRTRKTKV